MTDQAVEQLFQRTIAPAIARLDPQRRHADSTRLAFVAAAIGLPTAIAGGLLVFW